MEELREKEKNEGVLKLRKMKLEEVESYGRDIQVKIGETIDEILKDTKLLESTRCKELGGTGSSLNELASTADKLANQLEGKKSLMVAVRKYLGIYNTVENRLDDLSDSLTKQTDKLNVLANSLINTIDFLRQQASELKVLENDMMSYYEEMERENDPNNSLKMQALASRVKAIATTRAITEQELGKTQLIAAENKEIVYQLNDAIVNVVPMFKLRLMTSLAVKVQKEALEIKEKLIKISDKMTIEGAKDIERTADMLIESRKNGIADVKTLKEASQIIQNTLEKVMNASKVETEEMMRTAREMRELTNNTSSIGKALFEEVEKDKLNN